MTSALIRITSPEGNDPPRRRPGRRPCTFLRQERGETDQQGTWRVRAYRHVSWRRERRRVGRWPGTGEGIGVLIGGAGDVHVYFDESLALPNSATWVGGGPRILWLRAVPITPGKQPSSEALFLISGGPADRDTAYPGPVAQRIWEPIRGCRHSSLFHCLDPKQPISSLRAGAPPLFTGAKIQARSEGDLYINSEIGTSVDLQDRRGNILPIRSP